MQKLKTNRQIGASIKKKGGPKAPEQHCKGNEAEHGAVPLRAAQEHGAVPLRAAQEQF
jgi:hypothetical protein